MKNIRLLLIVLVLMGMGSAVEAFKIGRTSGRGQEPNVQQAASEPSGPVEAVTVETRSVAEPVVKTTTAPALPPRRSSYLQPGASSDWIKKASPKVQELVNDYIVPIVNETFGNTNSKGLLEDRTLTADQLEQTITTLATTKHPLVLELRGHAGTEEFAFMKQVFPEATPSKNGLLYQFLAGYVGGLKSEWVGSYYQRIIVGLDTIIIAAGIGENHVRPYSRDKYTTQTGVLGAFSRNLGYYYQFDETNVMLRAKRDAAMIYKAVLIDAFGDPRSSAEKGRISAARPSRRNSDDQFGSSETGSAGAENLASTANNTTEERSSEDYMESFREAEENMAPGGQHEQQ